MNTQSAAAFIRRELEHASDAQLVTLGTARRRRPGSTVPAIPAAVRSRLKHAIFAAGHEPMGATQDVLTRYIWAGITRAPLPRKQHSRMSYSLVSRGGIKPAVLQAADLEAQGVAWALLADQTALGVADYTTLVRSWNHGWTAAAVMNDFFGFLFALVTFKWLGDRSSGSRDMDDYLVMFGPKSECATCADGVYFDTQAIAWKHLSRRRDHRAAPVWPEPSPVQMERVRADHLRDLDAQIASLIKTSDRLGLASISDAVALDALDRINTKIVALGDERSQLQDVIDLSTALAL